MRNIFYFFFFFAGEIDSILSIHTSIHPSMQRMKFPPLKDPFLNACTQHSSMWVSEWVNEYVHSLTLWPLRLSAISLPRLCMEWRKEWSKKQVERKPKAWRRGTRGTLIGLAHPTPKSSRFETNFTASSSSSSCLLQRKLHTRSFYFIHVHTVQHTVFVG